MEKNGLLTSSLDSKLVPNTIYRNRLKNRSNFFRGPVFPGPFFLGIILPENFFPGDRISAYLLYYITLVY